MQNFFYLHIWIFIWNIDRIKLKYQSGYISLFSQSIKICKIVLVMLWHAVLTFKKGRLKLCSVVIILVILLQIWWYWYYCCCYYGYRLGCCWWLAVKGNISYVVVGETFKICIIELLPPSLDPPDRWKGVVLKKTSKYLSSKMILQIISNSNISPPTSLQIHLRRKKQANIFLTK